MIRKNCLISGLMSGKSLVELQKELKQRFTKKELNLSKAETFEVVRWNYCKLRKQLKTHEEVVKTLAQMPLKWDASTLVKSLDFWKETWGGTCDQAKVATITSAISKFLERKKLEEVGLVP